MPRLSIIIPTHNRPVLFERALASALNQTAEDIAVIVVDDASATPVSVPNGVHLIRLPENKRSSAARNIGIEAAQSRWVMCLDDDDELLPHFAETALAALENTDLPAPVAALSGMDVIGTDGLVVDTRRPPTVPQGGHFQLERIERGLSFFSKQTLVVERDVILGIGGYDPTLGGRELTDVLLRLNPVCSILGIPTVGYRHYVHDGNRISSDPLRRQRVFDKLVAKHRAVFDAHPFGFSTFLFEHAVTLWSQGQRRAAVQNGLRAAQISPVHTLALLGSILLRGAKHSVRVSKG